MIPEAWLRGACKLPPKTLSVAIALWSVSGRRGDDTVILSNEVASRFGANRKAKAEGLRHLEEAGLVSVRHRGKGRSPEVTILPFRG